MEGQPVGSSYCVYKNNSEATPEHTLPAAKANELVFSKRALSFIFDNMGLTFLQPGSPPVYKQSNGMERLAVIF